LFGTARMRTEWNGHSAAEAIAMNYTSLTPRVPMASAWAIPLAKEAIAIYQAMSPEERASLVTHDDFMS
jgi:hypothetical protein